MSSRRTVVRISNRSGSEVDVRLARRNGELHVTLLGSGLKKSAKPKRRKTS